MDEDFNISLTFKERLVMGQLFPQKASLAEQVIVRDLVARLGVKKEEKEELNFRRTPNGWEWDEDKEKATEAAFTKEELEFLNERLDTMDKEKAVTKDMVDICLKIRMFKKEEEK